MDATGGFLAGVIAVAGTVYFAGRHFSRRKFMHGREPMATDQILKDLPDTVSRDEALKILQVIGKCFGMQPEILRLEDPISALTAIDSWALGKGQEELESWLRNKGVEHLQNKVVTIRDLILSALPLSKRNVVNS